MQLSNVNSTDLREAIALGCRTMSGVFNADDNDIPFFGSLVRPTAGFGFHPFHSASYIPGHHLNALLNAEAAVGIKVEEPVIEKHARAAYFSYSGPVALPLNRDAIGGKLINFAPHNIREGLHALYALVKFRQSPRAQQLAEDSIKAIFDLWRPDTGGNRQKFEGEWHLRIIDFDSPFIGVLARAIGPLTKYFVTTGYAPALQLATRSKTRSSTSIFWKAANTIFRWARTRTPSLA
ncbi:MAG: hypothetical protein JWN98_325 [Abditibacteriota bacterium]|jgi:hypothetical protein|nr:hypothetical protein [Abditibacteriota bacterium]